MSYPLSEREALLLGDFVVQEARKENRPTWTFYFDGETPHRCWKTLRDFGYRVSEHEMLHLIGR